MNCPQRNLGDVVRGIIDCPSHLAAIPIASVTADSRSVIPGSLFIAVNGTSHNGTSFIADAIARGAAAILSEQQVESPNMTPILLVPKARFALARAAANFFDQPGKKLSVIGVTGTNGKTTSCWLLHQALTALGKLPLRLGTAGNFLAGVLNEDSKLTTLDPVHLHRYFALAADHNATHAVMEASSHALHQLRLVDVPFRIALFTNLTRDHLDYHSSFEAYEEAKRGLFDLLTPNGVAVLNCDDPCGRRFAQYCIAHHRSVVTFGRDASADICLVGLSTDVALGSELSIRAFDRALTLHTPLIGDFNAENVLGVFAALVASGFSTDDAQSALRSAVGAPGRLERFTRAGRTVFVDYAHTPDALERALKALRPVTKGSLSVVFGCGGDRDRGKRPIMGEIATRCADHVILTSDNPRTEDPLRILSDIAAGAGPKATLQPDRAQAIEAAMAEMGEDDVLLIAGKGHENYQIFADRTVPFSDQQVVRDALHRRFP